MSAPAFAQQAAPQAADGISAKHGFEEIVVTAQRRAQSLQDVPISISAFTAEALARSNVTEAKDYLQFSSNVTFTEDGATGPRSIGIAIRGVGNVTSTDLVTTGNGIGFYIDELSVGSVANGTINPQLQDMERIEVLRGPQGTYFGRNALGGAVNITTKKPDENLYGEMSARYGRFNTWDIQGVANLPVTDNFFLRAAVAHEESDGMIKNVNPLGTPDSGYKNNNARLSARLIPSDRLTLDLSVTYTKEKAGLDNTVPSGVIDGDTKTTLGMPNMKAYSEGIGFYPQNQRYVNHNAPEFNNNEFVIVNGRINYTADSFAVSSITGYIYSHNERMFDQDNISADIFNRAVDGTTNSFSQELRVQSVGSGPFEWTFGGIAAEDKLRQYSNVYVGSQTTYTDPATGITTRFLPPFMFDGFPLNLRNRTNEIQSYGLFAEGTYHFNEAWSLTLGARYTHDKVTSGQHGVLASNKPIPDASGKASFNDFSPRAVLKYNVNPDLTTYLSASRGYKAGGVDINRSVVNAFDPEKLWNYEAGFKSTLADGRVRLNASAFYLQWKDIQVITAFIADPNDISSSTQMTLNASEATAKGFELGLETLVTDGLQVGVDVGYLDAKFGSFPDAIVFGGGRFDLSGKRMPKSPTWNLSGNIQYTAPITDGIDGFVRAEGIYRSAIAGNLEAVAAPLGGLPSFPYQSPSYTLVNLRAGIDTERFSVQGYVENLFKKDYFNGTFDHFGLSGIRLQPHPRVWGLRLTYRTQ
nr:TonB-dependent receptor [Govania unica]